MIGNRGTTAADARSFSNGASEQPNATGDALRVLAPQTLVRDEAFDRLRDAIITGHFPPGARLVERELCEAMGVSRTSIREVLRRLEAEKLVRVEPRRGPEVVRLSRKQVAEIYEIRAILEAMVVRRFTEMASDEDIAQLRAIFEEIIRADENENVYDLVGLMKRFIEHMMRVVDHELISDIHQQLIARISVLRVLSMSMPGRIQSSMGELRDVIEAIERRDADAAAESLTFYVRNAADAALARFDATQAGS
jgi:GntR family transcriptional regulator, trigonelline degradation regulator